MPKIKITVYDAVIENDFYEGGANVLLGVEEEGHPDYAVWESYVDTTIYYYLTPQEMADLKVGDVLNDGEDFTIVAIDKENPQIVEVEYELEEEDA